MFDGSVVFDLYSGNCCDNVVVLFNSKIFVWEFSGCINACLWQIFISTDVSLFLLFFSFYKSVFCVSACVHVCDHTFGFFSSPYIIYDTWYTIVFICFPH